MTHGLGRMMILFFVFTLALDLVPCASGLLLSLDFHLSDDKISLAQKVPAGSKKNMLTDDVD